jgi:hypothetical protein
MSRWFVPILLGILVALTPGRTGIAGPKDEKGDPRSTTSPIFRVVTGKGGVLCANNETLVSLVCAEGAPDGSKCRSDAVGLCARKSAQVDERLQRSATDDPAVTGHFPNGWAVERPNAAPTPTKESELGEFQEQYRDHGVLFAPTIEENLKPGGTGTVELPVAGPSGLSASVRWVGTIDPVEVTLALDGSKLATTGTTYHFGLDRGGSLLNARTTSGGRATITVTNTSDVTIKVRIVFTATAV